MNPCRHSPPSLLIVCRIYAPAAPASPPLAQRMHGSASLPGSSLVLCPTSLLARLTRWGLLSQAAHCALHASTLCSPPRFPSVALSWAAVLLRNCDRQQHGIDLFGRDAFLLGRLLITLGALCMLHVCCAVMHACMHAVLCYVCS